MRVARLVQSTVLLVAAMGVDAPAHAAWVTHEAGLGAGVSVLLGPEARGARYGAHLHGFWDSTVSTRGPSYYYDGELSHGVQGTLSMGAALALRYVGRQGARYELKARVGPALTWQDSNGHLHYGLVRGEAGLGMWGSGEGGALVGVDGRVFFAHGEWLRELSPGDRGPDLVGLGGEVGLLPRTFMMITP